MLLSVAVVCALAFSFTGCDDEGATCAEKCLATYNADVAACEAEAGRVVISCADIAQSDYASCLSDDCGVSPE